MKREAIRATHSLYSLSERLCSDGAKSLVGYWKMILVLALLVPILALFNHSSGGAAPALAATSDTTNISLNMIPTYESIGIYLSFDGDENSNNEASFEYRKAGTSRWIRGMDMTVDRRPSLRNAPSNPYVNEWRASVLLAEPGTEYEIKVTISDPDGVSQSPVIGSVSTWIETDQIPSDGRSIFVATDGDDSSGDGSEAAPFKTLHKAAGIVEPGDTVYVKAGTYVLRENVELSRSGDPDNYITFRNYEDDEVTLDIDYDDRCSGAYRSSCAFGISGSYIRVHGFEIFSSNIVTKRRAMWVKSPAHDIIIENNVIKVRGDSSRGIVIAPVSNSSTPASERPKRVTIQRNTIFVWDTGDTPDGMVTPGPGVDVDYGGGNYVFRDNYIEYFGSPTKHGRDCFVSHPNFVPEAGFWDSDIYDNECINATDDGVSLDGGSANVRVWGNFISGTMIGVSIAPVLVGPAYIFRNVVEDLREHWAKACFFFKMGEEGTGDVFIYHNTFYAVDRFLDPSGKECRFISALAHGADPAADNITAKNNIFEVNGYIYYDRGEQPDLDYNLVFDHNTENWTPLSIINWSPGNYYDLETFTAETGREQHGIYGQATFVDRANDDYRLANGSLGIDSGVMIQGFNDPDSSWSYSGSAPDIGALELQEGPSVLINGGDEYTSSASVTLNLSCFAESGVQDVRYSNDGTSYTAWEAFSSTKPWTLPSGEGAKVVSYQCRDNDGNVMTAQDEITLETSPPSAPPDVDATTLSMSEIDISWFDASDPESGISNYNVYRNGSADPIATTPTTEFSDSDLSEGTAYTYEVSAINGAGLEGPRSAPVTASTLADLTPPVIISVSANGDPTKVSIVFSESLDESGAETASNYDIDNGTAVSGASLQSNGVAVTLTTSALSEDVTYILTVNNVRDLAGNEIAQNTTVSFNYSSGPPAFQEVDGIAVMEAEHYTWIDQRSDTVNWTEETAGLGYIGDGYVWTADAGASNGSWDTASELAYMVEISTPGEYFVAVRHLSPDSASNSALVGVDDSEVDDRAFTRVSGDWVWSDGPSLGTLDAGTHTVQIRRREDGMQLDRVVIADSLGKLPSDGSSEEGPPESATTGSSVVEPPEEEPPEEEPPSSDLPVLIAPRGEIGVGQSASLPIILDSAPNGIAGYNLEVTLSDSSVAKITGVEFPEFGLTEFELISDSRIRIQIVDGEMLIQSGATDATLANLEVQGSAVGETVTDITILSPAIQDDNGDPIELEVSAGTLTVSPNCPQLSWMDTHSQDLDGNGVCEDLNGNSRLDFADIVLAFQHRDSDEMENNAALFDYNGNGLWDYADVTALFEKLTALFS